MLVRSISMKEKFERRLLEWLDNFSCPRTFLKLLRKKKNPNQNKTKEKKPSFEAVQIQRTDGNTTV